MVKASQTSLSGHTESNSQKESAHLHYSQGCRRFLSGAGQGGWRDIHTGHSMAGPGAVVGARGQRGNSSSDAGAGGGTGAGALRGYGLVLSGVLYKFDSRAMYVGFGAKL